MPAASDQDIEGYYMYLVDHGSDSVAVGTQIQAAKAKYGGIIPKPWLDHMTTLARQKFGEPLNQPGDDV
jgi:hypothetical protein